LKSIAWFSIAAVFEIGGCFSFWLWLRKGSSAWVSIPGVLCLLLFAACLSRVDSDYAGRAYAAYGGIYIVTSLLWLRGVEGVVPDRWDLLGSGICLVGALVVLLGPRS